MHTEMLYEWFQAQGGSIDTSSIGITEFPLYGRGGVALRNIEAGQTLFSVPRELTLSIRTSSLPNQLGEGAWKQFGLDSGWSGLILCLMWEEAQGDASKWSPYLRTLPSTFDTPIFWDEDDLCGLQGTAVLNKIGKNEAERDYTEKVVPAIQSRGDIFPADAVPQYYSLQRYHIMGSRILSRSFHVEPWSSDEESETDGVVQAVGDSAAPMEIDVEMPSAESGFTVEPGEENPENATEEVEIAEDEEDDDSENPADVAMVPMADMLNARFGSENAKLFYEKHELKMVSTKFIKAGEQIWNTYGDPPNSDLLRRYGHVDVLPLSSPLTGEGNPADIVEIRADLVVDVAVNALKNQPQERVDWWLENADDDTFVVLTDCEVPEELVSFVRLLLFPQDEWEKIRNKGKLPKPKVDIALLFIIADVLRRRAQDYPTSLEDDELLLAPGKVEELSLNGKNAAIVRLGEKRILRGTLQQVQSMEEKLRASMAGSKDKKRGRDSQNASTSVRGKRSKR